MDRLRTSFPTTNHSDEVIDLTIDSPVPSFLQPRPRLPRRGQPLDSRLTVENWFRTLDNAVQSLPYRLTYYDNTNAEQNDSSIQVIDPDEPLPIIHQPENEEENVEDVDDAKEYSAAIPCVRESIGEELLRLSCPICFEPLIAKQKPTTTRCGHIFCAECLKQSLRTSRNKTCPICNTPVKIKSCIRLHFL